MSSFAMAALFGYLFFGDAGFILNPKYMVQTSLTLLAQKPTDLGSIGGDGLGAFGKIGAGIGGGVDGGTKAPQGCNKLTLKHHRIYDDNCRRMVYFSVYHRRILLDHLRGDKTNFMKHASALPMQPLDFSSS